MCYYNIPQQRSPPRATIFHSPGYIAARETIVFSCSTDWTLPCDVESGVLVRVIDNDRKLKRRLQRLCRKCMIRLGELFIFSYNLFIIYLLENCFDFCSEYQKRNVRAAIAQTSSSETRIAGSSGVECK